MVRNSTCFLISLVPVVEKLSLKSLKNFQVFSDVIQLHDIQIFLNWH